ncbi:uncharacterized protein CC84DRAFT_315686 [Paraphaeosphaeria sporulosa]|uniref:Uncharacterized protein n=1 Tax=Paraphaeosphaeria sporulosa TaxID=1460663 RepID=A0A177C003_9PLEO|nr:uncharacterized protein CC84DRAFT_315686 [Paraphaeosphaeria sporulosa]OAG00571.1 hypothetical protein CC84DRAFT_315686 [Paraphaeosphaeria sporulosa]
MNDLRLFHLFSSDGWMVGQVGVKGRVYSMAARLGIEMYNCVYGVFWMVYVSVALAGAKVTAERKMMRIVFLLTRAHERVTLNRTDACSFWRGDQPEEKPITLSTSHYGIYKHIIPHSQLRSHRRTHQRRKSHVAFIGTTTTVSTIELVETVVLTLRGIQPAGMGESIGLPGDDGAPLCPALLGLGLCLGVL